MAKHLDRLFFALSDATRRAILRQLADGPAAVSELAKSHDMALPTFLRHVEILAEGGLVVTRKTGRRRIVALVPKSFDAITGWVEAEAAHWQGHRARLEVLAWRIGDSSHLLPGDLK